MTQLAETFMFSAGPVTNLSNSAHVAIGRGDRVYSTISVCQVPARSCPLLQVNDQTFTPMQLSNSRKP